MSTLQIQSTPISINGQTLTSGMNGLFNLGPSVNTTSNNAYGFLMANNAQNQAFVGAAAAGGARFLAHQLNPLSAGIAAQQTQNLAMLPQELSQFSAMQTETLNFSQQFANQALQAINTNSQYAMMTPPPSSGGGCYITTAICQSEGLPDDCDDLTTLRDFRDNFMMVDDERRYMVKQYYRDAPEIVAAIELTDKKDFFYAILRKRFLDRCLHCIRNGLYMDAVDIYREMVYFALCFSQQVSNEVIHG